MPTAMPTRPSRSANVDKHALTANTPKIAANTHPFRSYGRDVRRKRKVKTTVMTAPAAATARYWNTVPAVRGEPLATTTAAATTTTVMTFAPNVPAKVTTSTLISACEKLCRKDVFRSSAGSSCSVAVMVGA